MILLKNAEAISGKAISWLSIISMTMTKAVIGAWETPSCRMQYLPADYLRRPFFEQLTETMLRVSLSNAPLMGLIMHFCLAGVVLMATL